MKAPVPAARRRRRSRRVHTYSALIYRAHKEVSPAGMRSPDFLTGQRSYPKPVLLRLVSAEASRLSKANRLKVITLREISAAAAALAQRGSRTTKAA